MKRLLPRFEWPLKGRARPGARAMLALFFLGGVLVARTWADAAPQQVVVANGVDLAAALRDAKGGETIALAPGDYGDLVVRGVKRGKPLVVTSASATTLASASSITIEDSADIVIRRLAVKMTSRVGVSVGGSQRIRLENLQISGQGTPDRAGLGNGAAVKRSTDVSIVGSDFGRLAHGISLRDVRKVLIERNDIHEIRVDGIHGGGASDLTIRNNVLRDFFRAPKDHPDAIQLWTTNATESAENILIEDNFIVRGEGRRMQGIFITDQSEGRLPYRTVVIRGNVVVGSMYHGIALSSATAPTIEDNLVMAYDDGPAEAWISLDRSTGATVSRNKATSYRLSRDNAELKSADNEDIATSRVGDLSTVRKWYATRKDAMARMPSAGRRLVESAMLDSAVHSKLRPTTQKIERSE